MKQHEFMVFPFQNVWMRVQEWSLVLSAHRCTPSHTHHSRSACTSYNYRQLMIWIGLELSLSHLISLILWIIFLLKKSLKGLVEPLWWVHTHVSCWFQNHLFHSAELYCIFLSVLLYFLGAEELIFLCVWKEKSKWLKFINILEACKMTFGTNFGCTTEISLRFLQISLLEAKIYCFCSKWGSYEWWERCKKGSRLPDIPVPPFESFLLL